MKDSEDWGFGFAMLFFTMIFVLFVVTIIKLGAIQEKRQHSCANKIIETKTLIR